MPHLALLYVTDQHYQTKATMSHTHLVSDYLCLWYIADFKVELNSAFEMSDLGLLHHYLGIQFKQCDGGIALCQTKYIETLLCRFSLEDCKPIATPM